MTEAERRAMRGLVATLLGAEQPYVAADLPLDLVRRHMLAPLAHTAGVPGLRNDYITSSLQAERRAAVLGEAVDVLAAAGVPVILLKGIAYAGTVYPDPAHRPMSDIDLLVRPSDIALAERTLARLGYWRAGGAAQESVTRHAITLKRRDGSIDLHRHILHAGRSRIDLAAIWRAARPAHVAGALRPAPEHEYLLHIAHIGRHEGMVPLINYVDSVRLRATMSPRTSDPLAQEWRVARASSEVSRALRALRLEPSASSELLAFPTPLDLLEYRMPARWLQLIRKLTLVDDWPGRAGLALAAVRSRVAPLRKRR